MHRFNTVLFDLDGTLVDTAPDMAYALDRLCREERWPVLPFERVRPVVSNGSVALVKLAFGDDVEETRLAYLKQRYLDIYEQHLCEQSRLFDGMDVLLEQLEAAGLNWGVVTNKPSWLTVPLLEQLGLRYRAATIVSGDTTDNRKPHPAPMYHACAEAGCEAAQCIYIGDARRDIEAGNNAGMLTLVALFGYIGDRENVNEWGADALIESPEQALAYLDADNKPDHEKHTSVPC
jgi:phosphoglycolate phosphatase